MIRRKYIKLGILFLMFSIFLISNISAQPPPAVQTNVNIEVGLQIQTEGINVLQQNTAHLFSFHVFNISTGLIVDNSTTNCSFHLFNKTGHHQFIIDNLEFTVDNDFRVSLAGSNFSELGLYSYYVNCNADNIGGFGREVFEVTQTGEFLDEPQSLIILGLILVLILVTWVFLYFGKEIEYLPFKIFLISLGALFLMFTVGFSLNIIRNLVLVGSVFSLTFVNLYRLMLILISAGGIGLMVYIIYMSVKQFYSKRGLIDSEGEPKP